MIYLTEWLLYICFALLTGYVVMEWVPVQKRPNIIVPVSWLYSAMAATVLLSLVPLIDLTFFFAEQLETTFMWTFPQMLQKMEIGKGWLLTIGFMVALFAIVKNRNRLKRIEYLIMATAMIIGLALSFSWSSHVSYIQQLPGFLAHSLHFLTTMIWMGSLFVVSWYAKKGSSWLIFLRWFTPLSIVCMLLSMLAGLLVMNLLISDYVTSWVFSYGQAILWKHIFVVLLLAIAFINGVLLRKQLLHNAEFDPLPWFRLESIAALAAFAATAVIGQQEPPHDVQKALDSLEPSPLFLWFQPEGVTTETDLWLRFTTEGFSFGVAAVLLLLFVIIIYLRKLPVIYALITGTLFTACAYLSLMFSV